MQHARRQLHRARRHNDWLVWLLHPFRDPIRRPGYRVPARIVPGVTISLIILGLAATFVVFFTRDFEPGRMIYLSTYTGLTLILLVMGWYQGHRKGSFSWPEHWRG